MAFEKITEEDLSGIGVIGLPDTPGLSTEEMQEKFEETSRNIIIPHFNALIDELEGEDGAGGIGVQVPEGFTSEPKLQALLNEYGEQVKKNTSDRHSHENKSVLDAITSLVKGKYDRLVTLFTNIVGVSDTVSNSSDVIPTGKAIVDYVQDLGGGDMLSDIYDTNKNGIVDNAEAVNGISIRPVEELPASPEANTLYIQVEK